MTEEPTAQLQRSNLIKWLLLWILAIYLTSCLVHLLNAIPACRVALLKSESSMSL